MPEAWLRITVSSPSEELTAALAEGLVTCGGSAVQESGETLTTYLAPEGDAEAQIERVRSVLRDIAGTDVPLAWELVANEDWLAKWRAGLSPRRIGPRVVVAPTWSEVTTGAGDIVIRIDPQMAFGTGEHATTRGVLRLLQRVIVPGIRVLDVGTGSGILAIAAARLGAEHVVAVENDADAIENAQDNVGANGVADRVTIVHAVVDDTFLETYGGGAFTGITANVLSGVLQPLLPAFHFAVGIGGWAILSGILEVEADGMRAASERHGFHVEATDVEEQWWSALLRRL
jgi:ribosomal protein L11 methyltransferase